MKLVYGSLSCQIPKTVETKIWRAKTMETNIWRPKTMESGDQRLEVKDWKPVSREFLTDRRRTA